MTVCNCVFSKKSWPSNEVLEKTKAIVRELIYSNLIPFRISPFIDGGVLIGYKTSKLKIYIEYDNDLDIGLIVEDIYLKETIENISIDEKDLISKIKKYLE